LAERRRQGAQSKDLILLRPDLHLRRTSTLLARKSSYNCSPSPPPHPSLYNAPSLLHRSSVLANLNILSLPIDTPNPVTARED